jgi:hypothetical protein
MGTPENRRKEMDPVNDARLLFAFEPVKVVMALTLLGKRE